MSRVLNSRLNLSLVRAALILIGAIHIVLGLTQLFAAEWFWRNIGTFPPFNRHYVGDLGSFQVPLGLALLWSARNPSMNRTVIACAVAADLIHALNHLYDDGQAGTLISTQTFLLLLGSLAFALVLLPLRRSSTNLPAQHV